MISLQAIEESHARIKDYIHNTPVLSSTSLNEQYQRSLYFKSEHLQKTGSFKFRGALNAVLQSPYDCIGVIAFSSGNHAQALACAAHLKGKKAIILMPSDSSPVKIEATKRFGATVVTKGVTIVNRYDKLREMAEQTGYHIIPPFDDERVMAGHASLMVEFLNQVPHLQAIVIPVGGGGLMSGVASAAKQLHPQIQVIGVEPEGADDVRQSLAHGKRIQLQQTPTTICDGIRTITPGEKTFPIMQETVDKIVVVPDEVTRNAQMLIMQRLKQVVEPTAAIGLGAVMVDNDLPKHIGIVLTGGNWIPNEFK